MANSPDIWNAVNGLNQQGYDLAPAHQTQPGGYGNLEAVHAPMVRLPPSFLFCCGTPCSGVTKVQKLPSISVCRTLTLRTQYWLLTLAGVSHQCPPSIATTWLQAPLKTQTVRKINTFIDFLVVLWLLILCNANCCCLFQSQEATEMHLERRRQATLWAKLWPR